MNELQTTIRIDEKLWEKLKKLAEKDNRSLNKEINFILAQYVEQRLWQIKNTIK